MRAETVKDARVTIVGAARSGVAAAKLLARGGATVFVTESGEMRDAARATLKSEAIPFEETGHTQRALESNFVLISPGVPSSAPIIQEVRSHGLPVFSEIEVASWFCEAPIVAITGSNGKTTTTSLLGHIMRSAGRSVHVGGNIGLPFSEFAPQARPDDVVVLEVSSFQLDHIDSFRPSIAVLLNVTPDHLDRYNNDFDAYARSKGRIFENQKPEDVLVYNDDDDVVRALVEAPGVAIAGPRRLGFSRTGESASGAYLRGEDLVLRIHQQEEVLMRAEELSLRGSHNLYNSLAAAVAARVMEVRSDVVRESLITFEGVPHRLEFVRELEGVHYVNDSKATNVNAVWYALESFSERLVLIAGGRDKGNDYATLKPLVHEKARAVVAIGESSGKVAEELGPEVEICLEAESMEEAVRYARMLAEPGDVVLLSPACASFDMFENFEERGDVFKQAVHRLD